MANSQSLSFEEVHEFVDGLFAGNLHAKRVLSLANATLGVITSASLAVSTIGHPAILAQVSRRPDATIAELRAWLLETHKISASTGLMNKTLAALDLTFKKIPPRRRTGACGGCPGALRMARAAAEADPIEACFH